MAKRYYTMDDMRPSPIGGAKLTILPMLSYPMFSFAVELARAALNSKDMRPALTCVILCAAALEAYINEVIDADLSDDKKLQKRLMGLDTKVVAKWREVGKVKGGGFEEDKEPFDSFKLLVGLRGFLLHFRVKEEPLVEGEDFESALERRLASKFPHRSGTVSTARYLTGACADWAVETTSKMIRQLFKLGHEPPSSAWVEIVDPGRFERQSRQT